MRRFALYVLAPLLLVAAFAIGVSTVSGPAEADFAPPISTASTAPIGQSNPLLEKLGPTPGPQPEEVPLCVAGITERAGSGTGYVVLTTNPRTPGIEFEIDGVGYTSDQDGCVIAEVDQGLHTVDVSKDGDNERRQVVNGKVRPLRTKWENPVEVAGNPLELEVVVEPPVCALERPQNSTGQESATALLAISTVPRTADVLVTIDGREYASDEEGCVVVRVAQGRHKILVPDIQELDESTRFVFGRWDDIWASERSVGVNSGGREMQLGIKIQHPVRLEFFDSVMDPLDASRLQTAKVVNSFGEVFPLSEKATEEDEAVSFDEVWLTANRLRRVSGGLFSDDNIYVFGEVTVEGQNVVQSGEIDYIPSLSSHCPDLSAATPQRCNYWRVRLLLFPFQVELRSFIFRNPVDADVEVYLLNGEAGEPVLESSSDAQGWVSWPQVPRGDYEIVVATGGVTTSTPTIVTGPKVERITVMTGDVIYFVIPVVLLILATLILFIWRPRWRLGLVVVWMMVVGFALSVPTLGAAVSRPLSASVEAIYTAEGAFVGIDSHVRNKSPVRFEQSYCAPDFELRIPTAQGIWRATYESHDFHDVEMSKSCRIHGVDPGTSRQLFSSTQGQEWFIEGPLPPPGVYEAFVRVFDIPAGAIEIDFRNGLAPFLTFGQPERVDTEQIPFTNPFED